MRHSLQPSRDSATLRILHRVAGKATISSFTEPVLIGSDGSCDVHLDDPRVAGHHAEIYRVGGVWWVRDLASTQGTYLNEECIDAAPVVAPSTLQLGAEGPAIWLDPSNRRARARRSTAREPSSSKPKTRAYRAASRTSPTMPGALRLPAVLSRCFRRGSSVTPPLTRR